MNKNSRIFSPILQIIIATSILLGHIIFGFILFPLQNSITKGDMEDILVSGISGVQKSLAMANSGINAPEYAYLFTEYDSVGKDGGFIIADNLHDIKSGKKVESCRTLEDAGIDINKYAPLTISQTDIFGNDCYFAYLREESYVIVAYIPVSVQKSQRTVNVFAALGTSLIIFIALFFLVLLLVQFLSRFSWFPPVSAWGTSGENASSEDVWSDDALVDTSAEAVSNESAAVDDVPDYAYGADTPDVVFDADMLPKEEVLSVNDEDSAVSEESASADTDGMAEYVEKMQELKKTAYKLGEEKLFKMADYLEKCGKAILAGSKDADKFMAEIESKTPIAAKYYDSCIQQRDLHALQNDEQPAAPEEEDLPKTDMSPAEIFATLEALYDGASSADDNAVNTQISTLRRINLPRKLNAVFPELELAAEQSDFTRIKAVIDSLRTSKT
jgi:hypothetical protein